MLTSRLFLRGTTRVPPAALLLFGASPTEIDVERVKQCGRVDLRSGARVHYSTPSPNPNPNPNPTPNPTPSPLTLTLALTLRP